MRAARGGAGGLQAFLDDGARYRLLGKLAHRAAPLQVGLEFVGTSRHDIDGQFFMRQGHESRFSHWMAPGWWGIEAANCLGAMPNMRRVSPPKRTRGWATFRSRQIRHPL